MGTSIIIPAYNAQRYLEQTVRSVLALISPDWDLSIVDDGSTDATGEIADQFARADPRIRAVHQPNRGLAGARNAGLVASDLANPTVLFLDADDLLESDALDVLSALLSSAPQAPAAHGAARLIDQDGNPLEGQRDVSSRRLAVGPGGEPISAPPDAPTTHEMLAVENCVQSAGAVLIKKSALARVGLFDQSIAAAADHDMWFRLSRLAPIPFTPRVVLAYRVHAGSMSRSRATMRSAGLTMRRRWALDSDPAERRLARHGYRLSLTAIRQRQLSAWASQLSRRQWVSAIRSLPLTLFCLAKTLPGVSRVILGVGDKLQRPPQ